MNKKYLTDSAEMIPVIAKDAGMDEAATKDTLAGFVFPSVDDQLSAKWLGGGSQTFLKEVADFFVSTGNIPAARDTYEGAIDASHLKSVSGM